MHQIAITTDQVPRAVVVSISGEFDISAAADVERQIRAIKDQVPILVVDLRAVSFLDSSALRLLVALDAHARAHSRRVVLVRGPDHVHRVFRITRLEHQLEFVDHPTDLSRPARREP
jgi:anti-sigma B factor antagonist